MKPMRARKVESLLDLKVPVLAWPKFDGVRAVSKGGKLMSKKLIKIPNLHTQKLFGRSATEGMDGELIVGSPVGHNVFGHTMSGVMSIKGEPHVKFYVFDMWNDVHAGYSARAANLKRVVKAIGSRDIVFVPGVLCKTLKELVAFEAEMVALGHEGIMVRYPDSPYKYGTSTKADMSLGKFKRFEDSEAVILSAECEYENTNPKTKSNVGTAKRSSAKAGKVARDALGGLEVRDIKSGVEFHVGGGWDDEEAARLWALHKKGKLVGQLLTYRFQPAGVKDKPRFPQYKGLRDKRDVA